MSQFNKFFTFGPQHAQVNVDFVWYDSFTKQKRISKSPTLDAISSFYNYGVCCARIACYMNLEGDGLKEASKMFMQAGWIFDQLKSKVGALQPSEVSVDFTSDCLSMLCELCLAQA